MNESWWSRIKESLGLVSAEQHLLDCYGYMASRRSSQSVINSEPVPWITYSAFEYLRQFDLSNQRVFEWGMGNSTRYWSREAKEVLCVEHDPVWFERVSQFDLQNIKCQLIVDKERYVAAPSEYGGMFDIIVIDGIHRSSCAPVAVETLNPSGLIILDNSDWLPRTASYFRDQGFFEVDFNGFGPICSFTWTTSIFFRSSFKLQRKKGIQPQPSIAAIATPRSADYEILGLE